MSIGTKMRGVGESTYYTKLLRPQLEEVLNESDYEMEHILGKRKLVVHTDRISNELNDSIITLLERESPKNIEVERYNHNMEISWRDINKYAACETPVDMLQVNPDYKNDLTSEGEWIYNLTNMKSFGDVESSLFYGATTVKKVKLVLPNAETLAELFHLRERNQLVEVDVEAPNLDIEAAAVGSWIRKNAQPRRMRLVVPKQKAFGGFTIWQDRPAYSQRFILEAPMMEDAGGAFSRLCMDKESILDMVSKLQTFTSGTHSINFGVHVDYQNDEDVAAAVAEAEAKGWTVGLTWNGTATAQAATTYGLRKSPIYARVGEHKMPDGTTERVLDWGHYVTNPEDYQEFTSTEEAKEYFGISEEN